jgi:hypothetical protein
VDQAVDCGLWNVVPLLANGCAKLLGGLEHPVTRVNPEHPKHAQWVTCLISMQFMEELGYFQIPVIVYRPLQHGAMHDHAET